MSDKFLVIVFLTININIFSSDPCPKELHSLSERLYTVSEEPYEVRIVFASNRRILYKDPILNTTENVFLSNQHDPIKRFFVNKTEAIKFAFLLNSINKTEPAGPNRFNAMRRLINLSESEKARLMSTIIKTPDHKRYAVGELLSEQVNIYIQQIRPISETDTLPPIEPILAPTKY